MANFIGENEQTLQAEIDRCRLLRSYHREGTVNYNTWNHALRCAQRRIKLYREQQNENQAR